MFSDFEAGAVYEMHNASQPQYIIYLEGEVEVAIISGEKRIIKPGNVLVAIKKYFKFTHSYQVILPMKTIKKLLVGSILLNIILLNSICFSQTKLPHLFLFLGGDEAMS